ncbi:MAG: flagellin [Planctomycetes bacterium]|nr:flagellin [Planctomycetota bacterium]
MSRINTNVAAIRAVFQLHRNQNDLNLHLERLSTGLRINRGADDPAGLIISENLRAEAGATRQAISNSTRASNVIATAEGAMNEVSALLLDLQQLIVSTANEAGLTDDEVRANQLAVDSILASIDRIGDTTVFGGQKLLDGTKAYLLSAVPPAALASVAMYAAQIPTGGSRNVVVKATQKAETAKVAFTGTTVGGPSKTAATTIELRGTLGSEILSFASGTTLSELRTAINNLVQVTGVSATISAPGASVASSLVLHSTTFGSDAFVSVAPITGDFVATGTAGRNFRDAGLDAGVLIDGQMASVQGFTADVRGAGLDGRVVLSPAFGQTLSAATFSITGGGGVFQLAPKVTPNGQLFVGFERIATTSLGSPTTGLLYTLRSGSTNDLSSRRFAAAQTIINEAIDQVSSYRGRLGSLQRNHIQPNINSQGVTLENVTAAQSTIRDADIAEEVSALTRAQILVQSTQNALQIANAVPRQVLSLLG